ncbi:MAG: sigma-54-dependent Fis family transcriptional regulator [Deltaproteobacteria bacterium]|nr:sigma-54-dependent Fis family transcriptional regulator [Deltaproteobacteria bacterium]
MNKTILVVDDEIGIRQSLQRILEKEGYHVLTASNGEEAFKVIRQNHIDLVVSDIRMAGMDGLELLKVSKSVSPCIEFIMITGFASVDTALDSMKEGAYDYLTKPFKKADILKAVDKAIEKQTLEMNNIYLKERLEELESGPLIESASPKMRKVVDLVKQVAPSEATVLILGESGTGKEVIADRIHNLSPRKDREMIKVNCAAIPETLIESELFGYEKGAFTGAASRREGRFEAADKSTIFLDEIGEIPPAVQIKLLRVLQEGTFERLGSNKSLRVDTRIIAATNKNLAEQVKQGRFREDLYWRLNVINIGLPLLKERKEDIPALLQHFLNRFTKKNSKTIKGITSHSLEILMNYDWPGNVRELENVVERCVVLDRDGTIAEDDLPPEIVQTSSSAVELFTVELGTPLDEIEKKLMEKTLQHTKGDKTLASKLLGVSTRTLYRKIDKKEE